MYLVGICDDGENICTDLESKIENYAQKEKQIMKTKVFNSGENLCNYLQQGNQFEILFLDIELIELNGIGVGKFIRNQLEDRKMHIIYISSKKSYAYELFKVQPLDFLIKPITQLQVDGVLTLATQTIKKTQKPFKYKNGTEHYTVPSEDILYFTKEGRKIKIVTSKETREFYGQMNDFIKELPDSFVQIHYSYVVNKNYIINYAYEAVVLANNEQLPISKVNRTKVRAIWMNEGQL